MGEAAAAAWLARTTFDLVAWGEHATPAAATAPPAGAPGSSVEDPPASNRPNYVAPGPLQAEVLAAVVDGAATDLLASRVIGRCLHRFDGTADYSASQLRGFPLTQTTAVQCLSPDLLGGKRAAGGDGGSDDRGRPGGLRAAELRLVAPERAALLQIGICTFFAVASLLRSL